ncbi:sugar ABC transporter permease [Geminicoccaceae bacterium SYSU G07066]|uniref:Sugar ABC transporter permease n=1 Tax=Benzoatithermus flavus TaxID=3108223 RepID=A0ABU8XUP6_9PROT
MNIAASGPARGGAGLRGLGRVLEPWCYIAPGLVLVLLVMIVPLVIGLSYAFQQLQILNPFVRGWVGLDNFARLVSDRIFWLSLANTLYWTFGSLLFQFLFGLGLALLLNRSFYGKRAVQALVFLPWAVPSFLGGLTWAWLFNPVVGPLPYWLFSLGLLVEPYNILGDPRLAMLGPIAANVWFGVPFFAITLLAALQSIPNELYEAASIDGAGPFQQFRLITLPFLAPMIAITVMLRTIWISNFADLIVVMTGGGPANTTQILASYIFTLAFRKLDFGYASAVAAVLLLLLVLYAALLIRLRMSFRSTT